MSGPETTIPKGSWVLVTGATGHIAAHTVKQFLERGFKVRGTVRDLKAAAWLTEDVLKPFADRGDLELVQVPDLGAKNAFDEAIAGVSAIVHIASILSFSDKPEEVIGPVVDSVVSILDAAAREPSVKSFVYTSSIAAAIDIHPGSTGHVGPDTWNDKSVEIARGTPPGDGGFEYPYMVYQASKVEAEKAVWAYVKEKSTQYTVNVISPSTVLGEGFCEKHAVSPYPWVKNLYEGNEESGELWQASKLLFQKQSRFLKRLTVRNTVIQVDVKDVALLHVAAALDPECNGARLQAWGEYCNMNDMLAVLRVLYPEHKFMDDFPNQTKLEITADFDQQLALLKKWGGQDGWTPMDESVADEMKGVLKWFH
ncbi:hypothetical protein CPLU01_07856 [Colletotrichum plurivorum]|uniref:NAD-dependent epimerase/dehydratase domain-containing protein n=1 Tax=Colletotrichum plurivorum TaxID=2175906 RepID=A0A8H6KDZ0_9PEZI|nr:hypothetical protein CPLU01_07856 [Colletotrichum plurivorum]